MKRYFYIDWNHTNWYGYEDKVEVNSLHHLILFSSLMELKTKLKKLLDGLSSNYTWEITELPCGKIIGGGEFFD